jgi:hypothetical protein
MCRTRVGGRGATPSPPSDHKYSPTTARQTTTHTCSVREKPKLPLAVQHHALVGSVQLWQELDGQLVHRQQLARNVAATIDGPLCGAVEPVVVPRRQVQHHTVQHVAGTDGGRLLQPQQVRYCTRQGTQQGEKEEEPNTRQTAGCFASAAHTKSRPTHPLPAFPCCQHHHMRWGQP